MGPKAEGGAHTNPGKTAKPNLPAWIQTLVRKVSCSLKMLKLQREIKTVLPCWIKSVFPEMFHGLVEVKGWDSEKEGKKVLPVPVARCVSKAERVGMCLHVGWQGIGKQPVGRAFGSPSRQAEQLGGWHWRVRRGLLPAHREQGATLQAALLDGTDTPKPFCSFYLEPRKCAVFSAATRGRGKAGLL